MHSIICLMEIITFLWQTWEEPGQDAPFLRLFPHLSPFYFADEFTTQPNLSLGFKSKAREDCTSLDFTPCTSDTQGVKVMSFGTGCPGNWWGHLP